MTMYRIGPSAVKIHLTGAELRAYRVTFDLFGKNEPAVVRLLEDLVVAAVRRFALPFSGSRLCVEVFARRDGGCYIYLSAAEDPERTGAVQDVMLYEFERMADLVQCCRGCLACWPACGESACYRNAGCYRLVFRVPRPDENRICMHMGEFGTRAEATPQLLAQTLEHFQCIASGDAVTRLAGWYSLPVPEPPPGQDPETGRDNCP